MKTARDRHGSHALHWAAGGGHLAVCCYLVEECGVDKRVTQPKDGRNALHWACRNGHVHVARWLLAAGPSRHPLAQEQQQQQQQQQPSTEGLCYVNVPTKDGTSALHWAVWQGHMQLAQWLVEVAGADLHARNSYGCNAIQWAAQTNNVPMCRWLAAAGLDLGVVNFNGHTALHKAAIKGQEDVCRWLLQPKQAGCTLTGDLDGGGLNCAEHAQPDLDGNDPAGYAASEGFHGLADWLRRQACS